MKRSEQFPEVREIADAVCSDCATPEQLAKLEQLLRGNFEAQHFYYDYINMHAQLSESKRRSTEVIFRRMTEEVVVRSNANSSAHENNNNLDNEHEQTQGKKIISKPIFISLLVLIGIIFSLLWLMLNRSTAPFVAHIINGNVTTTYPGKKVGSALLAGDFSNDQDVTIKLIDGDTLHIAPNSLVKIFNSREIKLKRGKITLEAFSEDNTIVHTKEFIVQSRGDDLSVALEYPAPRVISGAKTELVPLRWRPKHFWNFNGQGDRVMDTAGSAHGVVAAGATRVKGLIGQGAFIFDNSPTAHIELGSGGGTVPGSGSFAVVDGVTIEALIRPENSGEFGGAGEIFRQNRPTDEPAILLSFEHDTSKVNLSPKDEVNLSLNFGLVILGEGYHELKVSLDGRDGRPSLAEIKDGKYHHIVGTYNATTGVKAIYLDGKRVAFYQHPPGSIVVSGGSSPAVIGNSAAKNRHSQNVFTDVIDEVAFYDFALSEFIVNYHLLNIKKGYNYYGLAPNTEGYDIVLPERIRMVLSPYSTYELVPSFGIPAKLIEK
ncbi:LamG domain-containing protein [Paraglaciecola aquimarina]|uniref:LamG domain-containing protein n=1 Tax=Paraglaciecola algarum TaxID=3050085 RepID=A0ABS9D7F9_9ALTE|nr:LamG domain-containing protein [Paraglaciecola sp. G1-23]MCF2948886.1 LamG domain-containing protein [Paraglaciecola sp. G1-23]